MTPAKLDLVAEYEKEIGKRLPNSICKVCHYGVAKEVDTLLAGGAPKSTLARFLSEKGYVMSATAIRTHQRRCQ